jgi:chloride channel protein, CIC family
MSGRGIVYDTSAFNAEATRPALAEGDITPAVLGITQRAPVFAAVFTAELTHPPPPIWGMLLLAAAGAHWVRLLAGRRRRPAEPDRAEPHFKHCQRRWLGMTWRLVDGSC